MKKLSIIIPCFQSQESFDYLISEIQKIYPEIAKRINIEFVLVDDGSRDNTFEGIIRFKSHFPNTIIVKLTGNFGSYPAFLAGLHYATGDCFAQLHVDLQDPPEHLPQMIDYWIKGWKLIIGQRIEREENFTTRFFARMYHSLIKKIALPHIPEGGFDLILFDREIRDEIVHLNESNINLVYLISSLKHHYVCIPVKRVKRRYGKSAWTFNRKVKLFVDTIVGFSYFPVQLITTISIISGLVFGAEIIILFFKLFSGDRISDLFVISLFMSLVLFILTFVLAIIGEYLWRTLEAARARPPFVVDKVL